MTTYYVSLTTTASHTVRIEANSEDAAIEAAELEGAPSLCHQCSDVELGDWQFGGDRKFDIYTE